ncbi:unnamed protein product [Lactuca virosa]|uniref:Chaperonin-like RbcX protein n=1 Tax=Lactuca virosa TaxID=75947 RepID=A0AAU9LQ31_9ASTR|nr:unnamed protein product [Lactuca virosa]
MIGGMAVSANAKSCPCFGLFLESKCSLKMKKNQVGMRKHKNSKKIRKTIVNELGGQYEEVFNDVKLELRNCFTAKAVRTVLYQLYEMNPPQYIWLHNFIAENDPADGKRFLRILAKEYQDLAERVMITRLHLYGKWIKQCDHGEIYKEISDENLELMRERLLETIVWPAADEKTTD